MAEDPRRTGIRTKQGGENPDCSGFPRSVGAEDAVYLATLNAAVPWEVEVRGGAYKVEADLSGLKLTSFALTRGSSDVDLTLPDPSGVVPVRVSGGASKVNIRRPAGVEAHLSVKDGASKLTFDEQNLDAVGGKLRLQSPGYDSVSDCYEIEVSGGASKVTVQRANKPGPQPRLGKS